MKRIFFSYLILIGCLCPVNFFSQSTNSDSLLKKLERTTTDTARIDILNNLAIYYYQVGLYRNSIRYYSEILNTSKKINHLGGMSIGYNGLGIAYQALGNYSDAVKYMYDGLKLAERDGDQRKVAAAYINIALVNMDQGSYAEAEKNIKEAQRMCEKKNDTLYLGYVYNTKGLINYYEKKYNEAVDAHLQGLIFRNAIGDKKEIASSLTNLGIAFFAKGNAEQALKHTDSARINFERAKKYYDQSMQIMLEINNDQGIAASYLNIGSLYTRINKHKEAKDYILKALDMYSKLSINEGLRECYLALIETDTLNKQYQSAFKNFERYIQLRDSLQNQENIRKITQVQMQYDFDKKMVNDSLMNAEQKKLEKIKHEEQIREQRMYAYGGIIGFVLMLVIAGISFRAFKNKQKANLVITAQKEEVEKQKQLIEEQKLIVEEHQKDIIDSITYAKRLQDAILPSEKLVKKALPGSFILYLPKDIVAGDFYWFEQRANATYIAAADCTGHGVPGAMVSVVCSNALNRALLEFNLTDPGKLLDKTRELVLETFSKSDADVKDGMDISLLKIETIKESTKISPGKLVIPKGQTLSDVIEDRRRFKITWAGANNPLWYISGGQFIEVAPNKQPIGKSDNPSPFQSQTFEVTKNDSIFLITDGFADQFGGPKGKKFKYRQLMEKLASIYKLSPEEQKARLEKTFRDWKGDLEQVDDVTLIGITL